MQARKRTQPPAYRAKLGHRIAELRRARGLSQSDLGESLGAATETISRIERAVSLPSLGMLERMATALGVAVEDFFSGRPGSMRRPPSAPAVQKLLALVGSKPDSVQRQALRLVRMFLRSG